LGTGHADAFRLAGEAARRGLGAAPPSPEKVMPTQANRILYVTPPSSADTLLLSSFSGTEAMSRLFSYQLQMVSESDAIQPADIVGKSITWSVTYKDNPPRYFNGYVSRFAGADVSARKLRAYRAQVVPWLWFLTRTSDCQIFQKQSATDIIQAVFSNFGFSDFTLNLKSTYAKRDYCVQYRETAFNFVSRLMEEEGISYFFTHDNGKHTLVLFDQTGAYTAVPSDPNAAAAPGGMLDTWDHQYEFRPGKWTRTDYNFETPSTSLLTSTPTVLSLPNISNYEMFDYPGDYLVKADGDASTKLRMQEDEVPYEIGSATSECPAFTPGGTFELAGHSASSEDGLSYVVTDIQHWASDADFETGEGVADYHNSFHCIPDSVTFRPGRQTPKPLIAGAQTAVVVGPSGEEIYTDKYGRVKVQFFWDRYGTNDENSSCWIRVSENWAGKNWGIVFNPRIGQEVLVEFLEGDPDRPIITGRVYNAVQMPPYALPANQTMSTIKTRSSKSGTTDNFNELRFEDKKGSEEIFFHAEKDYNREVENNDTLKVGSSNAADGSQTINIYNNRTETVQTGNESVTISKGNRTVTVSQGDDAHVVTQGKRTVTVQGDDTHEVKQGNRSVKIDMGNDSLELSQGNRSVKIDMGNDSLELSLGNQTTKLDLGASSTEAMQSITLKVGQNSITIDQTGITISGLQVSIQGQIQVQASAPMVTLSGDAMVQISGGITMIG
jgi:type VI secretion system secreted protein VgrG